MILLAYSFKCFLPCQNVGYELVTSKPPAIPGQCTARGLQSRDHEEGVLEYFDVSDDLSSS